MFRYLTITPRFHLLLLVLTSFLMSTWGIQKTLPLLPDVDEPIYVNAAITMASSGDMNPHWFGNPGSTTIYPLVVGYQIWHAVTAQGRLLAVDPNLQEHFANQSWQYFFLGRLLSVAYSVLSGILIFHIGQIVFNRSIAFAGSWLYSLLPLVIFYNKMVRTDSAGTFFTLLSIFLCLKILTNRSLKWNVLAGLIIGVAISTRYFLVTLLFVLLTVDGLVLWQIVKQKRVARGLLIEYIRDCMIGLLAVTLGFILTTPYFFLDFGTVIQNLQVEARATHVGADGLSPLGNFSWYIQTALPSSLTIPLYCASIIGILICLIHRKSLSLLIIAYSLVFIIAISTSALHWNRWIIQILPIFALLAANGTYFTLEQLQKISAINPQSVPFGLVFSVLLLFPMQAASMLNIRQANDNPRLLAREWIINNLPQQSRILQESYTAPLQKTSFQTVEVFSLSAQNALEILQTEHFDYAIVSSSIYNRYFNEPERYREQIKFYEDLFSQSELVQEFIPTYWMTGPTLKIYRIKHTQMLK